MCFCVLLYFTACMLYYCNTVGWDWGLIWWLTILLQCFETVGWVTWPVKISSPNDLYCVEWDVKPYSTQLNSMTYNVLSGMLSLYTTTTLPLQRYTNSSASSKCMLYWYYTCDHRYSHISTILLWHHSFMCLWRNCQRTASIASMLCHKSWASCMVL